MTLRILDTDHLSLLLQGHPHVAQRITEFDPQAIVVTIVTVEELLRGRLHAIQQASQPQRSDRLTAAYAGFQNTIDDINNFFIVKFDQAAYECYRDLWRQRIRIGTRDLRIAAIALSLNAIVVTRNTRDFSQVPELNLEDWTVPYMTS